MICFILGWSIMNTHGFSTVWGWLTVIVWMVAHNSIFFPNELKQKWFPILLAVSQVMTVIMWFAQIVIKIDQRADL